MGYCSYTGTDAIAATPTLSSNTPPTITAPSAQTQACGGTAVGPLTFPIGDAETIVSALVVTATSSNTTLLPNANITITSSKPNPSAWSLIQEPKTPNFTNCYKA